MAESMETPHPQATPEFGAVTAGGPAHRYPERDGVLVTKVCVGAFDNNCYVVRSVATGEGVLIDASAPPARILEEIGDTNIRAIVITHNHPDHTAGLAGIRGRFDVPVLAHPDDAARIPSETEPVRDGDTVRAGDLALHVLHTPGHTPGSVSLLLGSHLFSGDTLFPAGPGNTSGDPKAFERVMRSLDEKLFTLPDETRVSPGHGLDTTIGRERPYVETWRTRSW